MELSLDRVDTSGLEQLIRAMPGKADDLMAEIAQAILGDVVLQFNTSPPGREYKRRGVKHIASQAGNPPNVDTGALRASLRVTRVRPMHYELRDGVAYGIHLEYGTSRMAARPFIAPVFEQWRNSEFAAHVQRRMRDGNWWR